MSHKPDNHPEIENGKVGVLLVNLGTPDAPTPGAVRRYLREFLSDRRVVDLPRALWLPILHLVILNIRPRIAAKNYKKVWRENPYESPLRYFTRRQAQKTEDKLVNIANVDFAMRYGNPSIANQLSTLKEKGCDRILVLPLYPQYSATTTATVFDAVSDALRLMRWQPAIRMAPAFYADVKYIKALSDGASRHLAELDERPDRIVISFHGLPQRYLDAGDPYYCHCSKTARLLRESMGWSDDFAPMAFQSKFGREKWLEPATDETIKHLRNEGVENIAVIMPGFFSDCIETLEEIDIASRALFLNAGGKSFSSIPCINDSDEAIALILSVIQREAAGWIN